MTHRILIIGDSISIGYAPHVAAKLGQGYLVTHNEGNGGDSSRVRDKLDEWLQADADADLVHFNCGLHDVVSRQAGTHQVELPQYRENLTDIAERLRASLKRLVWASTTPVIFERHHDRKDFDRFPNDILAYNAAAAEIMSAAGIAVNDLHHAVLEAGPAELLGSDGVHFTEPGYALLGEAVANEIRRAMEC